MEGEKERDCGDFMTAEGSLEEELQTRHSTGACGSSERKAITARRSLTAPATIAWAMLLSPKVATVSDAIFPSANLHWTFNDCFDSQRITVTEDDG